MNSYGELVLNSNLPTYNQFNFTGNLPNNYYYQNNNVNYPFNNINESMAPLPAVRRYAPWQISKILNNNARRERLAKMALALHKNKTKRNSNIPVKHRRTSEQKRHNLIKAIKDPYVRIRHEISNEPSYLPNIRKNLTKKQLRKASPLRPTY